jgi:hypothetical protein
MRYGLMLPVRAGTGSAGTGSTTTIGALSAPAALGAVVIAMALAIGCSSQTSATTAAAPQPPPVAAGSPQVITNLSQLSSGAADTASLSNAAKVLKSNPSRDQAAAVAHGMGQDTPSTLRRLFLEDPDSPRFAETLLPHTQVRLLNAKAAEYPGFSNMMITQLLSEMVKEEKQEPIVTLELSEEIKPVVVTAILDDKGQLKELIYEQHSGLAAIDNFVIAACKESLWGNNVPKGALSEDGKYRLRIEAQLSKYSADREGNQTFVTRLGLGIL